MDGLSQLQAAIALNRESLPAALQQALKQALNVAVQDMAATKGELRRAREQAKGARPPRRRSGADGAGAAGRDSAEDGDAAGSAAGIGDNSAGPCPSGRALIAAADTGDSVFPETTRSAVERAEGGDAELLCRICLALGECCRQQEQDVRSLRAEHSASPASSIGSKSLAASSKAQAFGSSMSTGGRSIKGSIFDSPALQRELAANAREGDRDGVGAGGGPAAAMVAPAELVTSSSVLASPTSTAVRDAQARSIQRSRETAAKQRRSSAAAGGNGDRVGELLLRKKRASGSGSGAS
eukprot:g2348.t1